ncbi:uncharacterized protein LOC116320702 [Oreochromis aureus]|uniref:uncharacterized protein LOC116320702 n=1 Tax=Oreochromis aureus TaxID=47969 RepID=UPI001954DE2C|nr:uncharacterized protein LOC116320702 [Oreochromis aureus]XP_039464932.1 uncharacterized protein LOC116320702 [Oreochromis aureus]XP_039464933.1 uncharacterized protein LOC116320702 [Oreochromis aureus]
MKMMMIVLLLLISQHASGVEVYEGAESVLLPCRVQTDFSRNSTAAVWDRDGLSNPTVHLRRQKSGSLDEYDDLSGQSDRYQNRTSMRVDALQTGDLSLTLKNPTVSDSGTYTCIYRKEGQELNRTEVQLKVTVPPPVWPKVPAAMLVILIILPAAFGLFMYCAYKRMKDREALQPEVVKVTQGKESVVLPFKTTADLPQNVTVEWRLTEPKHMKVHVYESGNNQPVKQDQGYRGRTEMNKNPLRTKDLSLTLKDLHLTDSGVYTCTVYNKDGNKLQKSVTLIVRVPQPEVVNVTDADESVLLPFKTTADLRQDITVEWRLTEPKERKVHVYKSGNNQSHNQDQCYRGRTEMDEDPLRTKDFSLTLKDLHLTDSGVYTCTVYNKDGHMLLQKSVTLSVREGLPDIVQVGQALDSVRLPSKTTAVLPQDVTVEWTYNNVKLHVYESGNNQPVKQDEGDRGRTEMNEDPLRKKDLSLTLKKPLLSDTGVYTCTVYNKDGHMLLQKSVTLHVMQNLYRLGTVYGNKSYLLEFQKSNNLRDISTVEWKLIYPKYKLIKKINICQGNEEDLSLNLEDLHLTDSGIYTCTAYRGNGDILLQRSVIFSVRDFQLEMVEVTEGEESVLLPFKTTADLHYVVRVYWTLTEDPLKIVHVYEVPDGKKRAPSLDPPYRGRTEMNKDPLRTGDLSLTLKKPLPTDSRSYTCTVYNKDGRTLVQKVVTLCVRATLKGTMADMLPCLRRRRAPNAEVKEDVRNTNHEDLPLMEVHSA